jgi:hypothetical protein
LNTIDEVHHDINRLQAAGHTWVTIAHDSKPEDVVKIFTLEKKLKAG